MILYLDSSVLLRKIFGEPGELDLPRGFESAVSSEILKIECFRTMDRMRISQELDDETYATRNSLLHASIRRIRFIRMTSAVVEKACQPFPTRIRSLDAIHLASALIWKEVEVKTPITFSTHDLELGRAAKAVGFDVIGC